MFRAAIVMLLVLSLLLGVLYPLGVIAVAQLFFPYQANGSLLLGENGRVYGSLLIGQDFSDDKYFWGRRNGSANLAYGSHRLSEEIAKRSNLLNNSNKNIPIDLITTSASGVDPHISVAGAIYQVERVARSRNIDRNQIMRMIERTTSRRQFGVLGETTVNVLELNLLLDKLNPKYPNYHFNLDNRAYIY